MVPTIAAAYTTLASDSLAGLVQEEYLIPNPQVILLRRAFNDNYLVTSGDQRYILRVYLFGKSYISGPDDFQFELDLLDHLAAEGIGVSTAVPRRCGEKLGAIQAPEGVRHYALFRYAPGEAADHPTEHQTRLLGTTLARIHMASDRFVTAHPRHSLDLKVLVDAALVRVTPYLEKNPDDLAYVVRAAARVKARLGALAVPPGGWGIIHGDPHTANCHFDGDRLVLFDFDTCGYGWRAYDLAIFIGDREGHRFAGAFLESYQKVRYLSSAEVDALPTFMRARVLWNAGDILTLTDIWGERMARAVVREMVQELRKLDEKYSDK